MRQEPYEATDGGRLQHGLRRAVLPVSGGRPRPVRDARAAGRVDERGGDQRGADLRELRPDRRAGLDDRGGHQRGDAAVGRHRRGDEPLPTGRWGSWPRGCTRSTPTRPCTPRRSTTSPSGTTPSAGSPATPPAPAGRIQDAAARLHEGLQLTVRVGDWFDVIANGLWSCAMLCTATRRYAEAATLWSAEAILSRQQGFRVGNPPDVRRREEALSKARRALGPERFRAAEERGAAMSLDTAAEYALMLTTPPRHCRPPQRRARDWASSAPGNARW